ncbi:exosortase/archaeosortase family protein [Candidatus Aenigmatarchaeota archaeon]
MLEIRLKGKQKTYFRILVFLIKFNIFAIPLYIALWLNIQIFELQLITAQIVESLLLSSSIAAVRDGILISIPIVNGNWGAQIIWDCIGWKSFLAYLALVFATDFSLKNKLKGLIFLPVISFVNIIRIWFMFYFVYNFGLTHYQAVHGIVWSWGLIITVVVLWSIWMKIFREK